MLPKNTVGAVGFSALLVSGSATANLPEAQAARLGEELTPLGAELAGNADGSIPACHGLLPV